MASKLCSTQAPPQQPSWKLVVGLPTRPWQVTARWTPKGSRRGYEEAMKKYEESVKQDPKAVTLSLEEYLARLSAA